jgi:hypothetical protein
MNYDEEDYDYDISELDEEQEIVSETDLPAFVREFERVATSYSRMNNIPAIISYYSLLGNLVQDMIEIPYETTTIDTRVHFCWIQTARTGKTTLLDYVCTPLAKEIYKQLDMEDRRAIKIADYNTASLIGSHSINTNYDANAEQKHFERTQTLTRRYEDGEIEEEEYVAGTEAADKKYEQSKDEHKIFFGPLHGVGIWMADEFESSGIFKARQHKENMNVLFQTLMNNFHNGSNLYEKQLTGKAIIPLDSKFTMIASTFPPEDLKKTITDKGILQRFLCFIWAVPDDIVTSMRSNVISGFGRVSEKRGPPLFLAKGFSTIYKMVEERFNSVGQDRIATIEYHPTATDTLHMEYNNILRYISDVSPRHRRIIRLFEMNLMEYISKLAVLSTISMAPAVNDESKRWTVYPQNIRQGAYVVRQCYMTLVDWLVESIKEDSASLKQKSDLKSFQQAYQQALDVAKPSEKLDGGYVHKELFLTEAAKIMKCALSSSKRKHRKVSERFITKKEDGTKRRFIKPKED